ncbi:MAG: diguanylate cyclase, partial [Alphaproteobacteria bacterium]
MQGQTGLAGDGTATAAGREAMFQRLIELGIALSSERDHNRLREMILLEAKRIPNADGGTLYLMNEEETELAFAIIRNDS